MSIEGYARKSIEPRDAKQLPSWRQTVTLVTPKSYPRDAQHLPSWRQTLTLVTPNTYPRDAKHLPRDAKHLPSWRQTLTLVTPNNYPRDGIFNPHPLKDYTAPAGYRLLVSREFSSSHSFCGNMQWKLYRGTITFQEAINPTNIVSAIWLFFQQPSSVVHCRSGCLSVTMFRLDILCDIIHSGFILASSCMFCD